MNALDWSGNGNIADEAVWLGAVLTFAGTLFTIRFGQKRIARQVDSIDSNLNHVGEPEPDNGPTLGQRVANIETRVDRMDGKVDQIGADLRTLSFHMMRHIEDEGLRTGRLEDSVRDMDRRHWEAHRGEAQSG